MLVVLGCGGGTASPADAGTGGGDGGPSPDVDATPGEPLTIEELQHVWCNELVECHVYRDRETCVASFSLGSDVAQLEADVTAGRAHLDMDALERCAQLVFDSRCSRDVLWGLPLCDDVIVPGVAPGAPCFVGAECQGGYCDRSACTGEDECCAGVCDPTAPVGGDCSVHNCVEGAYCRYDEMMDTFQCVAKAATGAPCGGFDACAADAYCQYDETMDAWTTCATKGAAGSPCTDDDACVAGTHCLIPDTGTGVCKPDLKLGDPCTWAEDCPAEAYCGDVDMMTEVGTCKAFLAAGEACTWADPCAGSAECAFTDENGAGTCTLPAMEGEACDPDSYAPCFRIDDRCDPTAKKCLPLPDIGEPCTQEGYDEDCLPYATCDGMKCVLRSGVGAPCGEDISLCQFGMTCDDANNCAVDEGKACPFT